MTGPCRFHQLPALHRRWFRDGVPAPSTIAGRRDEGEAPRLFVPCVPRPGPWSRALLAWGLYGIPLLLLVVLGSVRLFDDPEPLRRVAATQLSPGRWLMIVLLVCLGVAGVAAMVDLIRRATLRLLATRRRFSGEGRHDGLVVDDEALSVRHPEHFESFTCASLRREEVLGVRVVSRRHWFPKRSFRRDAVELRYRGSGGSVRALDLGDWFELPPGRIAELLGHWLDAGTAVDGPRGPAGAVRPDAQARSLSPQL